LQQLALISGAADTHTPDALFINAPLRDYDLHPRTNDYTLPVLGMAYIATYAQQAGFNVASSTPKRTAWESGKPRRSSTRRNRAGPA
jgi:hypothetical protein